MFDLILKNGTLVNEGQIFESDIAIKGDRIEKIAPSIDAESKKIIDFKANMFCRALSMTKCILESQA